MPTFDYSCPSCGTRDERRVTSDARDAQACRICGTSLSRLFSPPRIAPSATPSRKNAVPPRDADPAWERGMVGDHRPDGSFVPYINDDGTPIRVHQFQNERHALEPAIAQRRAEQAAAASSTGSL